MTNSPQFKVMFDFVISWQNHQVQGHMMNNYTAMLGWKGNGKSKMMFLAWNKTL